MVSSSLSKQWLTGLRYGQEEQPTGTGDKGKLTSLVEDLETIFPCSMEAKN